MTNLTITIRVAWWWRPAVALLLFKARLLNLVGRFDQAALDRVIAQGERMAAAAVRIKA